MTRPDFDLEMARLMDAFGKKSDVGIMNAYYEALSLVEIQDFAYAVTRAIQDEDRFPRVPKINDFIGERAKYGRASKRTGQLFQCSFCEREFFAHDAQMNRDVIIPCAEGFHQCAARWSSRLLFNLARAAAQRNKPQDEAILLGGPNHGKSEWDVWREARKQHEAGGVALAHTILKNPEMILPDKPKAITDDLPF